MTEAEREARRPVQFFFKNFLRREGARRMVASEQGGANVTTRPDQPQDRNSAGYRGFRHKVVVWGAKVQASRHSPLFLR